MEDLGYSNWLRYGGHRSIGHRPITSDRRVPKVTAARFRMELETYVHINGSPEVREKKIEVKTTPGMYAV